MNQRKGLDSPDERSEQGGSQALISSALMLVLRVIRTYSGALDETASQTKLLSLILTSETMQSCQTRSNYSFYSAKLRETHKCFRLLEGLEKEL